MRVLVATTAGSGHFGPLVPFALACRDSGHDVRVAAPASFRAAVEQAGLPLVPLGAPDPAAVGAVFGGMMGRPLEDGDQHVVREVFGRLAAQAALPAMRRLVDEWRPELVVREPAEVASYVVAEATGVPHVAVNIGLASGDDVFLPLLEEPLAELGCGVEGMAAAPRWTMLPASFDLPSSLASGPVFRFGETLPAAGALPSAWPDDRATLPLIYCTFGTVAASLPLFPGFYRRVIDAVAELPVRVLLTIGSDADPAALGPLPPSVHVERFWPQRDVLPHASAVVGHGGYGTTLAALAAGLPQVVLPLFSFDQFDNARRVAEVGAGVALVDDPATRPVAGVFLQTGPAAVEQLPQAIDRALTDAALHERATALAQEISELPPVATCLDSLGGTIPAARASEPARVHT
jgi:UDP:flavonoid glycosyltransferase YjiC (YdhE family)